MVYGRYNELVNGVYKPRYHWANGILGIQTDWWFGTCILFVHILGIITPIDFYIFQRGRYTTNRHRLGG